MRSVFLFVIVIIHLLMSSSCVSSLLQESNPEFSSEALLPALKGEFKKNLSLAYPSWRHTQSGAVLSVFSDCENASQNLNDFHRLVIDSIEKPELVSESKETLSSRKTFFKFTKGEIEGESIEVKTASFRIGNCIYLSSLSGKPGLTNSHEAEWHQFIERITTKK